MQHLIVSIFILLSVKSLGADITIDTLKINSNILSENRTLLILKPEGLSKTDSVSLIYMLDGEYSKNRFERIANERNKQIIGIGIINTDRRRDLLPANKADKFLYFIEKELIPSVESNYKVGERILFGHSFGGAFTIFFMVNNPALFDKYIASSPTPIMNLVNPDIYKTLENTLQKDIKFYFSYGSKDMRQVKKWASQLHENLVSLETEKLYWKSEVFDGKDHNTSDKVAIEKGIKF